VYIDRVAELCSDRRLTTCASSTDDGYPAFYDQHHMSLEFALETGGEYAKTHPDLIDDLLEGLPT
jgi:hypothetical protein